MSGINYQKLEMLGYSSSEIWGEQNISEGEKQTG